MLPLKTNLTANPTGMAFRIQDGAVAWEAEPVDIDPDAVLAAENDPGRTEQEDAKTWLEEILVVGPMPVKDIRNAADAEGHSWRTLVRAKAAIGVRSVATGAGGKGQKWSWKLPESVTEPVF